MIAATLASQQEIISPLKGAFIRNISRIAVWHALKRNRVAGSVLSNLEDALFASRTF